MKIQQHMGIRRTICLIFLVNLLSALAVRSSEEYEVFLKQLADPMAGEIDENLAELLWSSCNLDMIQLKEEVEGPDLCAPEERSSDTNEIISECRALAKQNIQKMLGVLHPQMQQIVMNCLREHNILSRASGEEFNTRIWHPRYLESLFETPAIPRRNFGSRFLQSNAGSPAPVLDLPPSPAQEPSTSPFTRPRAPSPKVPFFPRDLNSSLQPLSDGSSNSVSNGQTDNNNNNNNNNNHKPVIIAVVVTASVTFVVAVLFFLCCTKLCRNGSKARRTDERPLLGLSLSDFSGASPKPYAFGDSIKEEKLSLDSHFGVESNGAGAGVNNASESFEVSINTDAAVPPPPLKPPPGRVFVTSSGLPPLKPPPGRADPLPLEPPSSFKSPANTAGQSPPPPRAPPPPSLRPSGNAGRPPAPPPPAPPGLKGGPRPPPLPRSGVTPPQPPQPLKNPSASGTGAVEEEPKAKLKPFFWDKVLANPDQSMVWHQIKSGSFQFNEEMIETLFGYTPSVDKNKNDRKKDTSSQDPPRQYIQLIDSKKAQNLSILLRALNVTKEEVCDALKEGNELPSELIQNLLKMAPTAEEELKLRVFNGELSQLGPAERFLKALTEIPFGFKRLEALLFMCTLQEDVTMTKDSFATLEIACKELRNSRLFLKLLEAVLKTGNRMNDGTFRGGAQAFKLDTLLKLSDVKGTDGKTTLWHFVVQEIIRSEGIRAMRSATGSRSFSSIKSDDLLEEASQDTEEHYRSLGLKVVSGLSNELENVKKAATIDAEGLTGIMGKLGRALIKSRDLLNLEMKNMEEDAFSQTLKSFVQNAEVDIMLLLEEEKRIMNLVKSTGDYFHGKAGKDEGLRLFVIVRDFLIMLDKACREVRDAPKKTKGHKKVASTDEVRQPPTVLTPSDRQPPSPDLRQRLFPAITDRRVDNSSSDDEDP